MTRKSKARYGLNRTYKISPTVKALRSALFLGLATAAAAPAAQAGVCVNVVNDVICAGDFNNTLDSWDGNELAVVDPFDPTTIELDANVTVYGQDGVFAWNFDDLSLQNDGNVIAEGGWTSLGKMVGIYAEASGGSLDFTNNGWVIADKDDTYWYAGGVAVGVELEASEGVTAVNNGLIAGHAVDDDAFGLIARTTGYGDIQITNGVDGDIVADSDWRSATGIDADNWGGDLTIVNDGRVAAEGFSGNARGIDAFSDYGDITVTNGGYVAAETAYGTAIGIRAETGNYGVGDITVTNSQYGSIVVNTTATYTGPYGDGSDAYGIFAYADGEGNIDITNAGIITVTTVGNLSDAYGVYAYADGDGNVTVTNSGTMTVNTSGRFSEAFGIYAYADEIGNVNVTNSGTITVGTTGYSSRADGIYAYANVGGDATVTNSGTITISTTGDNGSDATGIYAYTDILGDISVTNSGSITVSTTGYQSDAYGIYAYADGDGNITISNTSSITASTADYASDAYGIYAYASGSGDIVITNTGSVTATARGNSGDAAGIFAYADGHGDTLITNNGLIDVYAGGDYGDAVGVWAIGSGDGLVSVNNNGTIDVEADGDSGNAIGIYAEISDDSYGDISVVNGSTGLITSTTDGNDGDAFGIKTLTNGTGTTTVTNYGDIAGIYGEGLYGDDNAWGIHSQSFGGDINITNAAGANIDVYADEENGTGIQANAGNGDIAIANNGVIDVYGDWYAYGIVANAGTGTINITNAGGIDVYADSDYAYGVKAMGYGDITVGNTGVIDVYADNDGAVGVYANAGGYGDVMITNTGSFDSYGDFAGGVILVDSYGWNAGIEAHAGYGDVTVGNSGLVDVVSRNDDSNGVWTATNGGLNTVTNTGVIVADSNADYGTAWGIDAESGAGAIDVNNNGGVVVAMAEYAYGIQATASDGDIDVSNSGDVYAFGGDDAWGIYADSFNGDVTVTNSGYVLAEAGADYAAGIYTNSNGSGNLSVTNTATGDIRAYGVDDAVGITAWANSGSSTVINTGDVYANSNGWTVGVAAQSNSSTVTVTNNLGGSVIAVSDSDDAYGIGTYTGYGTLVTNAGYVAAYSETSTATGIYADAWNDGSITVNNMASGDIVAQSGYGSAFGMNLFSVGGEILVTNNGDVQATSVDGEATGISAVSDYGDVVVTGTTGNVTAISTNDSATGIYAYADDSYSFGDVSVTTGGLISVSGTSADGIYAYNNGFGDVSVTNLAGGRIVVVATDGDATGISAQADSNKYGNATVTNSGSITVTSNGDWGDAYGMYVESDGYGDIGITSTGAITVTANGDSGDAFGIYAQHEDYGDVVIASGSTITVNANGDYGDAFGISAVSYSDSSISITNTGNVRANANGYGGDAFGIYSESFGNDTSIGNSGNIRATSADGSAWAIYHRGGDVAITNAATGNIFGVIQTDDGDDTFTNSGDWYATEGDNKYSSFSSGDDSVVNNTGARIFMEDSWIDMGAASAYGSNSFLNNGKIFVDGKYNVIDMGTANSVFTNNGASLHFEDGAADDQLTIFGDFAGTGRIVVDADGTSMLADRLYIDGDVITNTANVIDVFMDAYPSLQDMVDGEEIDVVHVSGTSAAANFNMGNVNVAEDALFTVDVTLNKHINYSGTNDLFSLGFEVSGLSPSGVAATSIAPAVQSLWHLGVGTVFQRQGSSRDGKSGQAGNGFMSGFKDFSNNAMQVADYQGASGVWMRAFTEDGQVSPDADRNFGMGGGQGFDLKNTGFEFGAGYAFNPQWTAGLLGGTSESTLRPADGGRAKVDADTFGAYVTYTPGNGFYADFSYRTMDFDGNGNAGGDDFSFKGDADGYSLEMGYGFKTASGLVVEPQFQYSKMDVNLDALDYAQGDFELTDGNSSQWRAGVALRKTFQTGSGEWTPYGSLSVINETDAGNSYLIGGVLTGNVDTSGNSTLLEAGATVHYGRMVFSGGVNWKDGGAYDSLFGGQVSVRFTW